MSVHILYGTRRSSLLWCTYIYIYGTRQGRLIMMVIENPSLGPDSVYGYPESLMSSFVHEPTKLEKDDRHKSCFYDLLR